MTTAFLTTIALLGLCGLSRGDTFSDCCKLGTRLANMQEQGSGPTCTKPPQTLGPGCRLAFSACCLETRNAAACEHGAGVAKNDTSCTAISLANPASELIAKQCCVCCSLTRSWNASIPTSESGWCRQAGDMCGGGDSSDEVFGQSTTPMWEMLTTSSEEPEVDPSTCPAEHTWNPERRVCEKIIIACPYRYFFDRFKGYCVKYDRDLPECAPGFRHNTLSLECEDIDECALNRTLCTGSEYECVNQPGSYKCLCRIGYRLDVDGKCTDIDECAVGLDNCHAGQRCNNKAGGFKCVRIVGCGFGYTLDDESQTCHDIDECKTIEDVCEVGMKCFNLPGSYICKEESCPNGLFRNFKTGKCQLCRRGYRFDNETRRCTDIDECEEGLHNCNTQQRCENNPGSFQCRNRVVCQLGYRMSENGMTCLDINECTERRHECESPYVCVNAEGSYFCRLNPCNSLQTYDDVLQRCRCKKGYRDVQGACHDIDECQESKRPLCKKNDVCVNAPGNFFCEPYSSCEKGFIRPNNYSACVDINECVQGTHRCSQHSKCINIPGSYACQCNHGFRKNDRGICEDVDECRIMSRSRTCPGKHLRCINVIGSFVCECEPGYKKIGWSRVCEDIDECRRNQSICGVHTCHNVDGSYECRCLRGYRMAEDRKSCEDVDECALFKNSLCPNSACVNTEGSYQCDCPTGYRPNGRGMCVDIDECAMKVCKRQNKQCINLRGSFRCLFFICPPDYTYSAQQQGFKCLQKSSSCQLSDTSCLHQNPKAISTIFIEVNNGSLPSRIYDVADRSTANDVTFTNALTVVSAKHPVRGPIAALPGSFRLAVRRYLYHTTVTVVASGAMPAPMDVRLELRRNALGDTGKPGRRRLHLYDTVTFINVFVTSNLP